MAARERFHGGCGSGLAFNDSPCENRGWGPVPAALRSFDKELRHVLMVEQSLLHITLNMNRRRLSPRSEVRSETIDLLAALIQKPAFAIPDQAAYRCDVFEPGGRCPGFQVLDADGGSLVSFGVGFGEACSQALWIALHAPAAFLNLRIKTQLESSPPRTPWLGVLLESGLLPGSPARAWLEDFVRCLSWSVMDRAQNRAGPGAGWIDGLGNPLCNASFIRKPRAVAG